MSGYIPIVAKDEGVNYGLEKLGRVIDTPNECYFPVLVDYREFDAFPCDWAVYASTDHGAGGIYLYVCNGDPRDAANWQTYDAAKADGLFDGIRNAPAANPIYTCSEGNGDTETPCVRIVDGQVYMTMHNSGFTKGGDNLQLTLLAISPDGVVFTDYDNGSGSAVILNADGDDELHTGYFRWAENPFSGVGYKYVGYALKRGGDQSCMCQWGSNDAKTWVEIAYLHHNKYSVGITDGKQLNFVNMDVASVRQVSSGLYYAIMDDSDGSSGASIADRNLYGVYLEADGFTVNRVANLELSNGGVGEYDEAEVTSPNLITYGDSVVMVYQAKDALQVCSIAVAEGKLSTSDSKTGRRYPHILSGFHTSKSYNFKTLSSFPSFLSDASYSGGAWTFTSNGLRSQGTGGSSWAAVAVGPTIVPDNYEMLELVINGVKSEELVRSTELVRVAFSDSISTPSDEFFIQAYAAPYFELQGVEKVDAVTTQTIDTSKKWFNADENTIGVRWYPKRSLVQLVCHGNTVGGEYTPDAGIVTSASYQPWFGFKGAAEIFTGSVTLRTVLASSVLPVIDGAIYQRGYVVLFMSKPVEFKNGGAEGWTLSSDSGKATATYYAGSGTDRIFLKTDRDIRSSERVTVGYTQPGEGWVDFSNNALATVADKPVVIL